MHHPHHYNPTERILTERDLPTASFQLINDVSSHGPIVVLRKDQPSIRITAEPEMHPRQEQLLAQDATDALHDPNSPWFDSVDDLLADLESRDEA